MPGSRRARDAYLVLIVCLLLLTVEESVDVNHLQLAHAVGLRDDLLHLRVVWHQRLDQGWMRARHDALQLNLPGRWLALIFCAVRGVRIISGCWSCGVLAAAGGCATAAA